VIFVTGAGRIRVYKLFMRFGKLISWGLLFTVLMAPALGMAICTSASSPAQTACAAHCAMMAHLKQAASGAQHQSPAPVKAPCCERKAPVRATTETAAQIVAPVQIALAPADSAVVLLTVAPAPRVEIATTPPLLASPLSLLCTLLI
jgi:hypothetical protein